MTCCKDCPDRHVACHGECEKYRNAKEYEDAQREEMRRIAAQDRQYREYTREFRARYKKRIGEK